MLPAAARLRRSGDFRAAVRSGRRAGTPALVVHLAASSASGQDAHAEATARIGFVVSRVVGSAATRNLVRRRLRHLMRDRLTSLPAGSRVVVRATPAAAVTPWSELGRQLDRALDRIRSRPCAPAADRPGGGS
ncbi:MAG TPA: ribonuclease P protein component [Mycobacteriales bacterium]|nr:ribonuclease P protein component [Mycobacteriales bacterium]